MPWADPEGGQGFRTPWKITKNIGFPSNIDPDSLKSQSYQFKPALNGGPLTRQQNAISKVFRWWADGGQFLVAFRSSLTTPSDKMLWIRACIQCVWTGSIEIKLSTNKISWYFGTYNVRQKTQTSLRKGAFSIQHLWLRYVKHANGLFLCLTTQTTTWKRALLYISLYKQTNLTKDHWHLLWVNAYGFQ